MYPHKISLPEEIRPSFDINVLPGNLPENAIDAARQTEKKYLSVHIALNKGVMKIKIDNSFSPSDIRQEKRGDRRETKILDQVNMNAFLHYECFSSFRSLMMKRSGVPLNPKVSRIWFSIYLV